MQAPTVPDCRGSYGGYTTPMEAAQMILAVSILIVDQVKESSLC